MSTMNLELKDNVHVLTLSNAENDNSLTSAVMQEYLAAFDTVEAYQGNTSLLITCEHEKTFSTGINLAWLMEQSQEDAAQFIKFLETAMYRLAMLSAPTIMCLNGNTYAGGAILSSAADFRVMRADRGRFCFPEVDIKIPFTPFMVDIVNLLPNKHALKHLMLTGKAFTGQECAALDIVDSVHPLEELQSEAFALATTLAAKDRATYTTIRNSTRSDIARHKESLGIA